MKQSDISVMLATIFIAPHIWPGLAVVLWVLLIGKACIEATKE